MPSPSILSLLTIVTGNINDPREFGGDGLHGYVRRHTGPCRHHSFPRLGRLFTNGAAAIVSGKLPKAVPMNGVSTGHFVRCRARRKEIFLTNGTVGFVFSGLAIVIVIQVLVDAHTTIVAMQKVFGATHAAEATVFTVVGTLFVRHPQVANVAMIGAELYTAVDTMVRFTRLPGKAFSTNYFLDRKTINCVVRVFRLRRFHKGK